MNLPDQTSKLSPRFSWRLSQQHQIAVALLASLALAAVACVYGWSSWQDNEGDIDQANQIPLNFKVDINQAEQGELMAIPGVGPKMAEAILEHRELWGPFKTLEQLQEVPGIGPKKLEQMKKYLMPID